MTNRESALREAGIHLASGASEAVHQPVRKPADHDNFYPSTFSGYGEYTPITVRSFTVLKDADLERN
jgi:hypothetical protein